MGKGMSGHQSARVGKVEWITPKHITDVLGEFDLDPCSPINRPWPTAKKHYTILDDGLSLPWTGRVWLNPPYGNEISLWLYNLSEHGDGIALVSARTETEDWRQYIWSKASAILFLYGRLFFHHVDGTRARYNSGAPSALVAYGENNVKSLMDSGLAGDIVLSWKRSMKKHLPFSRLLSSL